MATLFKSFKNLITWIPIIWKDRQWDHIYLLIILKKKLSLMEEFFRYKANYIGKEKDVDKIHICCLLLDRIIKDDYLYVYKKLEKKYGGLSLDNLLYPKRTKEEQEKYSKSFSQCAKHEDYLRKQDITYLFLIMKKHLTKWWD